MAFNRVVAGHRFTFSAVAAGFIIFLLLPQELGAAPRSVFAWDLGAVLLLVMFGTAFLWEGNDQNMAANAAAQQEGEWTVFAITLAGVAVSFAALSSMLGQAKDMQGAQKKIYILAVGLTLFLSWLVTQVVFALRYAHEYYQLEADGAKVEGGLEFPGGHAPDYGDFLYFAIVLGMTFQVSDVQITSRKLRRLATVHGLIGFLFNAVIIALTVNIAASLL